MALVKQDIIKLLQVNLGAIYFRQLEVETVGQVRSNLGSRQDNFQAIKDNYWTVSAKIGQ
jgi:transposase